MSGFGGGNISIGPSTSNESQSVTIATDQNPVPITISDQTNSVTIKGPSLSPSATDSALVTVISPNQQPLPVTISSGVDRTSTGDIMSTESIVVDTTSSGTATITISGIWLGLLVFEASADGLNWSSISGTDENGTYTQTNSNKILTVSIAGFNSLRVRGNTVTNGFATIFLNATTGSQVVSIVNPLPTGANTIGKFIQGEPNTLDKAWPVEVTDGTNIMPTGDSIARPLYIVMTDGFDVPHISLDGALKVDGSGVNQPVTIAYLPLPSGAATDASLTNGNAKVKLTDGTDVASIMPAYTAASTSDTALVVAVSPNNTVGITASSLPLPTGAATETTLGTRLSDATFTGRINTLGQKTSINSTPVVLASDQSAIAVTGTITSNIGTTNGLALDATLTSGTSRTKLTDGSNNAAVKAASTAAIATDPALVVAISPNNTIGITASSLPLPSGAATETTLGTRLAESTFTTRFPTLGQKQTTGSVPVTLASDQAAITISGTVTSNVGSTNGLALDNTLTGGTQKSINRGGAKGATTSADITSTAEGTDHQALDIQIYHGGTAKDPTQIRALTSSDVITAAQATAANLNATVFQGIAANLNATVVQSTGTNLHTVVDSGSITVSQNTASSLNATVAQPTAANLNATVAQPTAANLNATVVQATGTNLHTVIDAATISALTDGTQKAINRGGVKGATVAADITSTAEGADHQALDVQLYSGGAAINPTQIRALTNSDVVSAVQSTAAALSGAWPVKITDGTNTLPTMDIASRAAFQKITDGTNTSTVKAASTAADGTETALVVALSPNNSALSGRINSSYHADPSSYVTSENRQISIDAEGRIETFSSVTSDAGSFRDDFIGASITSSVFNVTFTNNSTAITGSGTTFTTSVKVGQWIKKSTDSETLFVEVGKIISDTSLTLLTPYQGTTQSATAVVSNWKTITASGGSISVGSSAINLASGTTNGESSYIIRKADYLPFSAAIYTTISQRIVNQTTIIGFRDSWTSPNIKIDIEFSGTDNTIVNFVTSSSSALADTQTTIVTIPNNLTTESELLYKIDLSGSEAVLSINDTTCARHDSHIATPYDKFKLMAGITNTGVPASGTTVTVDSIYFSNIDRVEISSEFSGEPIHMQIVGETYSGIQKSVRVTPSSDLSVEIDGSNVSAFGDIITAPNFPIMQFDFVHTLVTAGSMNQVGGAYITNTGTAGVNNGRLALTTGTNAAGSSVFISNKTARYRAGQGVTARFTGVWPTNAANSVQIIGMCSPTITWTNNATAPGQPITAVAVGDGFFFGYNGTSFGIRHKNSRASADTWYPQTQWNIDRCDGSGGVYNPSGFNWDKTKGNVMMVRYPYLGYGNIKFFVQQPSNGVWIMCHVIQYANSSAEVQVSNPSFNFFAEVINTGSTTNLSMYVGSVGVLLSGERSFLGPQFGVDAKLTVGLTELPVLSLRNCTSINGVPNRGMIRLRSISISADNANTDCRIRIRKNVTLTGSTFTTAISGTITASSTGFILTAAQSIVTTDIAATVVSAIPSASDVLFNTVVARNTGYQIDLTPFEMYVVPGDTITVTAISGAANNNIQVALNWNEDI